MIEQYDRPLIENAAAFIGPVLLRRQPDHLADNVGRTIRMDRSQLDPGLHPIDQRDPDRGGALRRNNLDRAAGDYRELCLKRISVSA